MKRILHIVAGMNCGGIEGTIMNLYRNIDKENIAFDFLVTTKNEAVFDKEIESYGGIIYHVAGRREGILKNKKELDTFFKKHREYTIVHMHSSSLSYIEPLKAAKRYGIKTRIITAHSTKCSGSKIHLLLHKLHQQGIKQIATHYFICSYSAGKWLYGTKVPEKNWELLRNGIDCNEYVFDPVKRQQIRKQLGLADYTKAIVNVGRFSPVKNHQFIIAIFKEFVKLEPNSKLFLVGGGLEEENVKQLVKEEGLSKDVVLTGMRKDIPDFLQAMDSFLMPSLYEGLPRVIVEAQGSGLPCLISDVVTREVALTDLVEFMSLDETAFDWAQKLNKIMYSAKRSDTRKQIINAGYDIKTIAENLQEFYLKVY